jgi:hypothetical protein
MISSGFPAFPWGFATKTEQLKESGSASSNRNKNGM